METLEFLLEAAGIGDRSGRPRRHSRYPFGYDPLEARPLLAAALPAPAVPISPPVVSGASQTSAGGQVGSLLLTLPINDLLASAAQGTASFYETPGPLSLAGGLLGFASGSLLSQTVTENQIPLNNGTPFTGTVWITEAPEPPGIFNFVTTASPIFSHLYLQSVNPQWGPPSFSHYGEDIDGSMNGVEVQAPVAVGPVGPSMTIEIKPVQPPPVAAQQLVGPPTQLQQDETTTLDDSRTPPSGIQEPKEPTAPGTGTGGLRRGPTPTFILRGRPIFGGGIAAPAAMPVLPPGTSASLIPPETEVARPRTGSQPGVPGVPPPAGPGPQGAPGAQPERREPQGPRGGQSMGREPRVAPRAPTPRQGPPVAPGAPPAGQPPRSTPGAPPRGQPLPSTPDAPPAGPEPRSTPGVPSPAARPQGDSSGGATKERKSSGDTAFLPGPRQDATGLATELIDAAIPGLVAGSRHDRQAIPRPS